MTASRTLSSRPLSRRQLLRLGAVGAVALATGAAFDELAAATPSPRPVRAPEPSPPQRRSFGSRPDLTPPVVSVARQPGAPLADGVVLLTPGNGAAPDGPLIVRADGEPIWVHPVPGKQATNLRVATYRGEPVLTWWEGVITSGYGSGEHVILDASYREVTRIRAGNGLQADLHELVIGPDDTAFVLATRVVRALVPTPSGGSMDAAVQEGVIQEIDIPTGKVLFEWHSLPEIDPAEAYPPAPTDGSAFDYLHANSIDVDGDGLLLSARHTWTVYRIDRGAGTVDWRLNGRHSDYQVPSEARFAWQHDARRQPDGTISIFDDGANGIQEPFETRSRGIVLALEDGAHRARLVKSFVHPAGVSATSQGSVQVLPDGGAFVGWGSTPRFTAFDARGGITLDATFEAANQSYRSRIQPWVGRPAALPDVTVDRASAPAVLRVSWNGATEVAAWQLVDPFADLGTAPGATQPATAFETVLAIPAGMRHAAARALDANGNVLVQSRIVTFA